MNTKLLTFLLLSCLLSGCVSEEWVKDYVASQTEEIKNNVQIVAKDVSKSKARVTSLQEEISKLPKDYGASLDALRHDLSHLDADLHEFSSKTQSAMVKLESDVHRDVTNQEGKLRVLMERVQKLDADVAKFRETLQSMDNKVNELRDILYPLTGKEIKK